MDLVDVLMDAKHRIVLMSSNIDDSAAIHKAIQDIDVTYAKWHASEQTNEYKRLYLVVKTMYPMDMMSDLKMKQTTMMYGWFQGQACWHGVWSEELEKQIDEILNEVEWMRSGK